MLSDGPDVPSPRVCRRYRLNRKHKPDLSGGPGSTACSLSFVCLFFGVLRGQRAPPSRSQTLTKVVETPNRSEMRHARTCARKPLAFVGGFPTGGTRGYRDCGSQKVFSSQFCVNTRLGEPQTLLASFPARTRHNRPNRRTERGEKYTWAERKARTQTRRKVGLGKSKFMCWTFAMETSV